jgi:hypothetical protein
MFSQLDIQLEMNRWMYSGCNSGSMVELAGADDVVAVKLLLLAPFRLDTVVEGAGDGVADAAKLCVARRLTTSMLCKLTSMPTRLDRYSDFSLSGAV